MDTAHGPPSFAIIRLPDAAIPRPGVISLTPCGVLFLDELPKFGMCELEVPRQPLEDRVVTISRARNPLSLPANFMLVAAGRILGRAESNHGSGLVLGRTWSGCRPLPPGLSLRGVQDSCRTVVGQAG